MTAPLQGSGNQRFPGLLLTKPLKGVNPRFESGWAHCGSDLVAMIGRCQRSHPRILEILGSGIQISAAAYFFFISVRKTKIFHESRISKPFVVSLCSTEFVAQIIQ